MVLLHEASPFTGHLRIVTSLLIHFFPAALDLQCPVFAHFEHVAASMGRCLPLPSPFLPLTKALMSIGDGAEPLDAFNVRVQDIISARKSAHRTSSVLMIMCVLSALSRAFDSQTPTRRSSAKIFPVCSSNMCIIRSYDRVLSSLSPERPTLSS